MTKRAFESEIEYVYGIKIPNFMNPMHYNKVNNIAEYNLLHEMLNPSKCTKNINRHYSPIIHGCMNTRKGKAIFNHVLIPLDSLFSSTILARRLMEKLNPKKYNAIQWDTQDGNVTTNMKVKIYFILPELSAKNL